MSIHKEGYRIIAMVAIIVAIVIGLSWSYLPCVWATLITVVSLAKLVFVCSFFRKPKRIVLSDPNVVFAPSDGKVVVIEEVDEPEFLNQRCLQISVFMSVFNVHINWFPVGGKVLYYKYHPGKFLVAWHPKSSTENERTTTVVDTGKAKVLFRQIAGLVARRIVSYAEQGKDVAQNSECGFIKFGSRVDVFVPLDSEVLVEIGQKVTGSQTPLAKI
ncbi:MAG: phosphatidylserine decarboxylase family protein [Rikenellaceae bacterium]